MAAQAQTLRSVARAEAKDAAAPELGRYAPSEPLVWHFAQGRYAAERGVPLLTRLWAKLDNFRLRLWHRRLGQPKASREGRLVLPLMRGGNYTRAEARSLCLTDRDYIYAVPVGVEPLDPEFRGNNPTLCRPTVEREKDALHARLYAGCDLRAHVNAELHAECERQRKELRAYRDLIPAAVRLSEKCDEV